METQNIQRELMHVNHQFDRLLQCLVRLVVGSESERERSVELLLDAATDPKFAARIIQVMEQRDEFMTASPELYWAAQLTLKGHKGVQMAQAAMKQVD